MFETSRTAAKPRRWISTMYPKYVDQIAGIYVRSEDINDRTSREIRGSIPEYSCTCDGIVSRCRGADCEAAPKALRKIAADDGDMSRERHSMPTLRWGSASEGGATSEDARRDQLFMNGCVGRQGSIRRVKNEKRFSVSGISAGCPCTRHTLRGRCATFARRDRVEILHNNA